ncbi:MAG: hypothetical protein FVQ77_12395 [Cytophagales bacterium]|nr:hypothetical protein [Cytophagales bacterium]
MEAQKFISKVLPDGHLSILKEISKKVGKIYEVILVPYEETDIFSYSKKIAKERKIPKLSEKELERIIHEIRGVKC